MPNMLNAEAILRSLVENKVDFVVVGGLAMIAHGSSHVTDDIDICYRRTPENIAGLVAAISPFKPYLRGAPEGLPFRFDAPTITAGLNFTLTSECGPLDVLGEIAGVGDYAAVREQSDAEEVFGLRILTLSIDGLIAAKTAAGRRKDQLHLLELEELKKLQGGRP
jgi:hypothetical protein